MVKHWLLQALWWLFPGWLADWLLLRTNKTLKWERDLETGRWVRVRWVLLT